MVVTMVLVLVTMVIMLVTLVIVLVTLVTVVKVAGLCAIANKIPLVLSGLSYTENVSP